MQENKILLGNDRNAIIGLFAINMGLFMFIKAAAILFATTPNIIGETSLTVVEQNLILTPQPNQLLQQPWSLFTHFFTHTSLINLLSNMLWLGMFSYLCQKAVSNGSLFPTYLYGGFAAGIAAVLMAAIGSKITELHGAKTGILALVGLLLAYNPKFKVLKEINKGGIAVAIICYVYLGVYLITEVAEFYSGTLATRGLEVIFTGIVAFVIGFLYGKSLKQGKDWGRWMHSLYDDLLGKGMVPSKPKKEQFYETNETPFVKHLTQNEANLNQILEKINLTGINSLTDKEQLFLQKTKNT